MAEGHKPVQSEYATRAEYKAARAAWCAALAEKQAHTEPEQMPQRTICTYLSHWRVLQTGPRELLNWRVREMRAGRPVLRSPNTPLERYERVVTPIEPGVVPFFSPAPASGEGGRKEASLLHLPSVVIVHNFLPLLDAETALNFMFVTRVFYNVCRARVAQLAVSFFKTPKATPMALSCYFHYERFLSPRPAAGETETKRARIETQPLAISRISKIHITRMLNAPQSYVKRTHLQLAELLPLIQGSIECNGSIDAVRFLLPRRAREQQAAALAENAYIASRQAQRIAAVNAALGQERLTIAFGNGQFHHPDAAGDFALRLLLGSVGFTRFHRLVRDYINMVSVAAVAPTPWARGSWLARALPIVLETLAAHDVRHAPEVVPYLLSELMAPDFYGKPLTQGEWKARIAHLCGAEFLRREWPTEGMLLAEWHAESAAVEIVQLYPVLPVPPAVMVEITARYGQQQRQYRWCRPSTGVRDFLTTYWRNNRSLHHALRLYSSTIV